MKDKNYIPYVILIIIALFCAGFIAHVNFINPTYLKPLSVQQKLNQYEKQEDDPNYQEDAEDDTLEDETEKEISIIEYKDPTEITANFAVFGDVFWGRYVDDWSQASGLGPEYPFSQLESIGKKENEYWIANLECPITTQKVDSATQENLLKFNCGPEYLPEASQWFDAFSLSNNHTDNMEEFNGYAMTQELLDLNGIDHFGHFNNDLTNTCTVVALPATAAYQATENTEAQEKYKSTSIPVALCGYHSVFRILTDAEIQHISNFAQHIPTIVIPHSGAEYVNTPDSIKTSQFRSMIDAGADIVIGHHPHAVQSTEVYNDKLIIYSQGNFIFDQLGNQMVTTGLGLRGSFSVAYSEQISAWQNAPDSCFNITFVCEELNTLNTRPQINQTFEPVYTSSSNKITKSASPADIEYIKRLTNIEQSLTAINK